MLGNVVTEKAPGVGGWGGSCTCPNGQTYGVGDNYNYCASLACINGKAGTCNRKIDAEWAHRKVVCSGESVGITLIRLAREYNVKVFYVCVCAFIYYICFLQNMLFRTEKQEHSINLPKNAGLLDWS